MRNSETKNLIRLSIRIWTSMKVIPKNSHATVSSKAGIPKCIYDTKYKLYIKKGMPIETVSKEDCSSVKKAPTIFLSEVRSVSEENALVSLSQREENQKKSSLKFLYHREGLHQKKIT